MPRMNRIACSIAVVGTVIALSVAAITHAQSPTHTLSVPVDATTAGDLAIINDFFTFAPAGTAVSQSLRRIVMAAAGEMAIATDNQISTDTALLTLDDGSIVALQEGDIIQAQPKGKTGPIFACEFKENPNRRCQPTAVCHPDGSGKITCMPIPPKQKCDPTKECEVK